MTVRATSPKLRHQEILRLVRARGRITVDSLAEAMGTSRETIRRDLNLLSQAGALRKFHGGALPLTPELEGSFKSRMSEAVTAKRAIARCASRMFAHGDALFIDTGSTTVYFAEELHSLRRLTVVTNSAMVAHILTKSGSDHRVFLLGGEYRNDNHETVGSLAISQLRSFRLRHAVLTVGAIDELGNLSDYNFEEAEIARAMMQQAGMVTVLADHSKFGRSAPYRLGDLDMLERLVTDQDVSPFLQQMTALHKRKITVCET